ncbi:hypothetical protein H8S95_15880 [Pontibacter sp. KCTC 32443]|uniref:hypothetical protein n=1 Tax=Pontibacter TaxID=323449 RepID=UPI00164D0E2B|nr:MULTISPECIES: hypothetical protein [Pontibacter]MBC5775557.1 hypothetical protein [Pontibacter sp. KCTC 32443]
MEQVYSEELELPLHQPVWKFCLLCFLSGGIYLLYWQYKSWNYLKQKEQSDIQPFWRAVFGIFFIISLNRKLAHLAGEKQGESASNYAVIAGVIYIIMYITHKFPDPYWVISLFAFLPLIPIVKYQNLYISEEYPEAPVVSRFNGWEIAIVILGGALMSIILLGFLFPVPEDPYY